MQDTIRQKILTGSDSFITLSVKDSVKTDSARIIAVKHQPVIRKSEIADTVSDCSRNVFSEVTFSDSTSFLRTVSIAQHDEFPFIFIAKNAEIYSNKQELLFMSLRDGKTIPSDRYKADWIVPILFFSALLLGVVRSVPGNYFRNMFRFLFMRGINENASRDTGSLFQWQSTLLNLSAFISVSMFCYLLLRHYDAEIPRVNGFVTWLACFGSVIAAVTIRHFICNVTGNISDETEIFREYIIGIYQVYRFGGIIFLILSTLILYAVTIPDGMLFFAGISIAGALYLLRTIRLFVIFLTRHVSILYLILYLCALEILPVVILVKYVTGLV